jgi:hypothetical protein
MLLNKRLLFLEAIMTKRETASLVIKLMGVFILIRSIPSMGVYFIVLTLPLLLSYLGSAITSALGSDSGPEGYTRMFGGGLNRVLPSVIQLLLGIWLFAGSRGIVKFWKRIRS